MVEFLKEHGKTFGFGLIVAVAFLILSQLIKYALGFIIFLIAVAMIYVAGMFARMFWEDFFG